MRRHVRAPVSRLLLVVAVVLSLAAPFASAASAQDHDNPWTVTLGAEQFALLAADVMQDAEHLTGLEPVAVFGGEVSGSGVTTEMTIGQKRYLLPGSAVTSGLAAMAEVADLASGWTIHSAGVENYFSTSSTTNAVVVTVPRGTLACEPGEYREVAVFEIYPGTSTIAANPAIPNDPGVGTSSAYSVVCTDGETTPFFGIANKGALQQYAPGVGIVEVNLAEIDVYMFLTPRDVDLRVAQSAASDITVREVDVVTAPDGHYGPTEPVDPATVPTEPSEFAEGAEGFLIGLLEVLSGLSPDAVPLAANPEGNGAETDQPGSDQTESDPVESDPVESGEGGGDGGDGLPVVPVAVGSTAAVVVAAGAKVVADKKKRGGQGGGRTTPKPPHFEGPVVREDGPETVPPIGTGGTVWVELERGDVRKAAYRKAAEIATKSGVKPDENGNVVPKREHWKQALDESGPSPEIDELRGEVDAGFDENGGRPEGVPQGATIEVDPSTGRAFWRPPPGTPPSGGGVVIS